MKISAGFHGGPWDGIVADFDTDGVIPGALWGRSMAVAWQGHAVIWPFRLSLEPDGSQHDVGPYVMEEGYGYVWSPNEEGEFSKLGCRI